MSPHRLKVRLNRLEGTITAAIAKEPNLANTFIIDQAVARALRDDCERAWHLMRKEYGPSEMGGPISAAEMEEKSQLFASIKERARAIGCPSYGTVQQNIDHALLHKAWLKRLPNWGGDPLTEAEDAEEAQARARVLAFDESPEGRDRKRIRELELRKGRSTAEQQELDDLRRRYSIREVDITQDRMYPFIQALQKIIKKGRSEEAEEDEKRRLRRLERQGRTAAAARKDE